IPTDQSAPFLVMVRTENALVNLTSPGTFETINATEGDNINIACFAFDSSYYYVYLNYSGKTNICDTKFSSGRCLNIRNISFRKDWFFECLAQARINEHHREDIFPDRCISVILFNFIDFLNK
ncbi:hypothetical protein Avbf_17748, partial [Armadillidium vulgare]